ncbi:MAG TPA: pilus assembly protein PilM, partial [Candidatus Paceibacterota bacterium]
ALAPPRYLAPPLVGIDVSASGVKGVRLEERPFGLVLGAYAAEYLSPGTFADGEFADPAPIAAALKRVASTIGVASANAALPEAKSYLFETTAEGTTKDAWRTAVEQKLGELVPLPPAEAAFDVVPVGIAGQEVRLVGMSFARRVVEGTLAVYDGAGISVRSFEGEIFAMARALLLEGDPSTTLIIDVGKTTTKLAIVEDRVPRFATTIGIGGHAFTLAIQKHFGVTEQEARRVKVERGIVAAAGNEDYMAAMLSTVSAIRDEIATHLEYWQNRETKRGGHARVSKAVLAGGNATVRGLPEYLEGALAIPVATGDVFTNLASREYWIPEPDYAESLAYATAIGLALRDYKPRPHVS